MSLVKKIRILTKKIIVKKGKIRYVIFVAGTVLVQRCVLVAGRCYHESKLNSN